MQIDAIITKGSEKCNAIANYCVGNPKVVVILQQQQDDDDLEIGSEIGYVLVRNALYWPFLASLFLLHTTHKCYQRIDAIADLLKALIDHSCLCTVS